MKPLFGLFEPSDASGLHDSALAQKVPALSNLQRISAQNDFVLYGLPADLAVAEAQGTLVIVSGRPQWRKQSASLKAVADSLLQAFQKSGANAVAELGNGFVAVILDRSKREVHLAIDRIGRCPLAYASTPTGGLCFSSDARLVARAAHSRPSLNPQALFDYAFFHAIPSPETAFAGVSKLPPAGLVHWRGGRFESKYYWQPDFALRTERTWKQMSDEFMDCLSTGVKASEPNEKTASFLSGGIDSSTVTGLLAKQRGKGCPAYTIGFEQAGYDESDYARTAAKHFGAELRINYVTTADVERGIDDLASIYDEPFGNSSAVPALCCARIAKQDGIDHLLAGDGGDELFAGNTRYAKQRIFEVYGALPSSLRSLSEKLFLSDSSLIAKTPLRKVASYVQQAKIPLPDRLESYNFLLRENIPTIFEPEFLAKIDAQHPFALMREPYARVKDAATLDRMLFLDWKFTLADNDLRKVTATCNRAGVDVSFPWLDDSVIDFSTRLPADWKMQGTKLRYFVKDALSSFLPEATITKSKHGFGLPFGQWLKTSQTLQARVYDLLASLKKRGVFRASFLDRLSAEHQSGHAAYYGTMVWVLATLEAWLQANDVSP